MKTLTTCPKCGYESIDIYRFQLPPELPIPLLITISKSVRGEVERLLKRYSAIELNICMRCGYTEIKFIARS